MNQEEFFKRYTYSPSRDRIGGGGFGTVYKAYDEVLHREVAIKVSEVKTTADSKKTFSLKDEFEALDHVPKHPNIANYEEFYSFEMPNGIFDYAVMQYYPDGNLSNAIKQNLTEEQKEDVAIQLLEGIDFLHKHKVVHRDLKPGNILIVKHGGRIIPLITDFGLSKAAGVVDGSVFSNSFAAGTPRYSSPEQLQGRPLRLNTDLWSYGAILYELFTGEQLFSAGSSAANTAQADHEIYSKIVNGDVQNLGKMPEKWRKVAERCLVVDAGKRVKDAGELFGIIKDDETEVPEDEPTPKKPHSEPDPLSPNKLNTKKGIRIGLGIAIVAVMGIVGMRMKAIHDTELYGITFNEAIIAANDMYDDNVGIDLDTGKALLVFAFGDNPKDKKMLKRQMIRKIKHLDLADFGLTQNDTQKVEDFVDSVYHYIEKKEKHVVADPDTETYQACQTIHDYRAYISDYGRNALHYHEAKQFVDNYIADSTRALAETKAKAEAEKQEDAAFKKCTTVDACKAYLKTYPQGRYVKEVQNKLSDLEEKENQTKESRPEPNTLLSLPTPNGSPNFVYCFRIGELPDRKSARSQDALLIEALNTYNITGFKIYGWAVPDEDAEESPITMSENYVKSIESQIKKFIRQSGKNVNNYSFETKGYGWDWNKLVELIRDSEIPDRDNIANSLNNSSNKEETLTLYPQLEKDVLPSMRRVEVFLY